MLSLSTVRVSRALLRYALLGLVGLELACCAVEAAPSAAAEPEGARLDLAGPWQARSGDDPGWARPGLDDSGWAQVTLPSTWQSQGFAGLDGYVWYRRTVSLSAELRALVREGKLGLLLGPTYFGAAEVWVDGVRAGSTRGWSLALPVPRESVIRLPAAEPPPELLWVALRVRSVGWASTRRSEYGPFGGPNGSLLLGPFDELAAESGYRWSRNLLSDLSLLLLAVVIGVAGLYHLLLYLRRRTELHYLWFGLLAWAFAVNTLALSWWIFELTDRRDLVLRVGDATGHLAAALAIQFLWPFFGRPIGRWLRAYQVSHLALAVLLLLWPNPEIVLQTDELRRWWLVPLLVLAAARVSLELRGRSPARVEARWIAVGGLALVLAELHQLLVEGFDVGELPVSSVPFGFAAVLLTMALALAHRFRRALDELEDLRGDLERKVEARTVELERRNTELERTNLELVRARRTAHQVFSTLSDVMAGQVLDGKYRLEEKVGSGGNAAVYRATHLELGRPVAIKIFQPVRTEEDIDTSLERFRREGMTACRVDHPNAVTVLDSGISETGIAYLVLELLEGRDLGQELRRREPFSPERCAEILLPVCDVLAAAAEAGVVHRDIKPGNIFLHRTGDREVVKVVDFGIATLFGDALGPGAPEDPEAPLTLTGHLLGTPPYLAPERLRGGRGDVKADVYSVGLVLYEMVTGTLLFRRESGGIDYRRLFSLEPPTPLGEVASKVPPELAEVVDRALALDPDDRPGPRELARMLAQAVGVEPPRYVPKPAPRPQNDG